MARRELGIRPDQAMRLTVVELREIIRRRREASQEFVDPLVRLPKGMRRMSRDQHIEECALRSGHRSASSGRVVRTAAGGRSGLGDGVEFTESTLG